MQSRQTFLLGSDQGYFPGLLIALLSTAQALDPSGNYHFIVLDGGIEDSSYAALEQHLAAIAKSRGLQASLQRQRLDLSQFDGLPKIWGRSAMTYARILAPEITRADSLVWIDADMIIFRDLAQFGPKDGSSMIAGVTDPVVLHLDGDCPIPASERPSADTSYINCGLLWMNLAEMRRTQFKEQTLAFMATHRDSLTYWDQTALNAMTIGRREVLPDEYNQFCLDKTNQEIVARVGLANLHMVSPDKPWLPQDAMQHTCRDLTFWFLWRMLTGEDTSAQVDKVCSRINAAEFKLSRRKVRINRLLRRRRGLAKWSKRFEDIRYMLNDLEPDTRAALDRWYSSSMEACSNAGRA